MFKFVNAVCLLLCLRAIDAGGTFTDSKGTVHISGKDKPVVVAFAHQAVTLKNYGLGIDQLVAVYGEFYNSGSDVDVANPQAGSSLPADPLHEEIQFIEKVVDLSPGCHIGYCTEFDLDTLLTLDFDEFIIHGYLGAWWGFNDTYSELVVSKVTEKLGKPPIYLELSKEGQDCPDHASNSSSVCPGISMLSLIERNFELAKYLNLDIPESLNAERQELCTAAQNFQNNMKSAQQKGIRVMPAYLTTKTSYFADAVSDSVLRMFEELGMPILHIGTCMDAGNCDGNYFWEYVGLNNYFKACPDGEENVTSSCNEDTLYPVDFWLYDHRTTLTVTDPDFTLGFPDKALMAGQRAYWPIGGRLLSPRDAAEVLNIVGPQVASASRIHPATECTPDVDVTGKEHRIAGLSGGQYACFNDGAFHNTKYIQECSFPSDPTRSPSKAPVASPSDSPADSPGTGPGDDTKGDDYCYICGSADVKMTNPDFQPFALFNDDNQSSGTCVELEEEYNKNRFPGASCTITLTTLTAFIYAPSACGCVGFEPPSACKVCVGRNVNREILIPDFGVTCGEGFDLIQHAQAAICELPDLNLKGLEEVCCPTSGSLNTNDGGNGDQNGGDTVTADESSASSSSGIPMGLLLCVLTVLFSV